MPQLLFAAAIVLIALVVPYHLPRIGVAVGLLGLALATLLMRHPPTAPDALPRTHDFFAFDLDRPIGIALALFSLLWLMIASVQLTRAQAR